MTIALKLITALMLLVAASFGIEAKSIVLPELDFSKVPEVEQIIDVVSAQGDSLVNGQKIFVISFEEYNERHYLYIGLTEGNKPFENNSDYPGYTGFYKTNTNIFFIMGSSEIDLITKTSRRERFELQDSLFFY